MNYLFNESYICLQRLAQTISILLLVLLHSCNCENVGQIDFDKDRTETAKKVPDLNNQVDMKITPIELVGEQKQIQVTCSFPNNITVDEIQNYRLEISFAEIPGFTNYIEYTDATDTPHKSINVSQKLNHFIKNEILQASKSYSLNFKITPAEDVDSLMIQFSLFDLKDVIVQTQEITWKEEIPILKIELQGSSFLIDDQTEFGISIINTGTKAVTAGQAKIIITQLAGESATVSFTGDSNPVQVIDLEGLTTNIPLLKYFKIHPGIDKRARFLFEVSYKGKKQESSFILNWRYSALEISQLYYSREQNQIYYQISNYGLLQKGAVELVYKNVGNNQASIAGFNENTIQLGDLRNSSQSYSSLHVEFNQEPNAKFEFKLLQNGQTIESKTINLNNIRLRIEGISNGETFRGNIPLKFYVKNITGVPINIEDVYIQILSNNGANFEWETTDDEGLLHKLSTYLGKNILEVDENISIELQLKDAYDTTRSVLTIQIKECCNDQTALLAEKIVNWSKN